MSNLPEDIVCVPITADCRMVGESEIGSTVPRITISNGGHDIHLLLEREALDRVMRLSQRMLAVPESCDTLSPIVLESTRRDGIQEMPCVPT
jgi:hypothetical protein